MKSNRRDFLKTSSFGVLAASVLASCSRSTEHAFAKLIPPNDIQPGEGVFYASTYFQNNLYGTILVKTRDGRPIKIEGNNKCKYCNGKTNARIQASIIDLYNIERLKSPTLNNTNIEWEDALLHLKNKLSETSENAEKVLLLSHTLISPSTKLILNELIEKYPCLELVIYDEFSKSAILQANQMQFNQRIIPTYNLSKSDLLISFGADFLAGWIDPIYFSQQYQKARSPKTSEEAYLKHIQLESNLSTTGAKADERITIHPNNELAILKALENILLHELPTENAVAQKLGHEIANHNNNALLISASNHVEVQLSINRINHFLNQYTNTIHFTDGYHTYEGDDEILNASIDKLEQKKYAGIICLNCNPVYELATKLKTHIKEVGFSVSLSYLPTETSNACELVLPLHHYLESWDDAQAYAGYYSLTQPAIVPLFNTKPHQDVWLHLLNKSDYHTYIQSTWESEFFPLQSKETHFLNFWASTLQLGFFKPQTTALQTLTFTEVNLQKTLQPTPIDVVVISENPFIGTGISSDNSWLHELPHPITKIAWGNYAMINTSFANRYHLKNEDEVCINDVLNIPIYIGNGIADETIHLFYGYGRETSAQISSIGTSTLALIQNSKLLRNTNAVLPLTGITKTGRKIALAKTQMNADGGINPPVKSIHQKALNQKAKTLTYTSLYPEYSYEGHHWAMAIDLNACTGCNTCVIACQAENNIPVVGKTEVAKQHEMHWIRMDRYFEGETENPTVHFQPVMCQHCNQAPCENVCPVAATTHSVEGINQMVYNRCVGTRYCNNNCPYKTRVFNWYDYTNSGFIKTSSPHPELRTNALSRMQLNPDVTVRSKGVIEKCSFCIQRIVEVKNRTKANGMDINDGDIQTACQQACPSNAIVFGDANDSTSAVAKQIASNRAYSLLSELNTKPSVYYLKKIDIL